AGTANHAHGIRLGPLKPAGQGNLSGSTQQVGECHELNVLHAGDDVEKRPADRRSTRLPGVAGSRTDRALPEEEVAPFHAERMAIVEPDAGPETPAGPQPAVRIAAADRDGCRRGTEIWQSPVRRTRHQRRKAGVLDPPHQVFGRSPDAFRSSAVRAARPDHRLAEPAIAGRYSIRYGGWV